MAPEIEKINLRSPDVMTFWPWPHKSRKAVPEVRINDVLAFATEVEKISPRSADLMTFRPRSQKSREALPEVPIY